MNRRTQDHFSIMRKHSTKKIVAYIFAILSSLLLVLFLLISSGSKKNEFIITTVTIWFLFFLFCIFKIHAARQYRNIFRKGMISVGELDDMDGIAFEELACDILLENGFEIAETTPASGDYGVDILAWKEGISYAIQCKRYRGPVGLEAVQQIYAGRAFYECHVAVVLTNQMFTANAITLADKLGVVLWDRETLRSLL